MSGSVDPLTVSTMYVGSNKGVPNMYAGTNPSSTSLTSNPSVVNQTLGWQSNYTVPYHYRIARWRGGYENSISNGQLLFIRNKNDERRGEYIRGSANSIPNDYPGRREIVTVVNLPMLNYALYTDYLKFERDVQDGKVEGLDGSSSPDQKDACFLQHNILERWGFLGTCINEGAAMAEGFDSANTTHRLINACIRGRQTTFNLWGDIKDSNLLYIKFQKITTSGTDFQLDCKNHGGFMHSAASRMCYQAIPFFTSASNRPTINKRAEGNVVHYVYVGRVFRTNRGSNFKGPEKDSLPSDEYMRRCREVSYMVAKSVSFEILIDSMYD